MAVVIPQVITEDRAAAPSVVTGSFSFPKRVGQQKLMYQPQSSGNNGTYTVSMWVKNTMPDAIGQNPLWSAGPVADNNNYYGLYLGSDQLRYHNANPSTTDINGSAKLRDPNGWYHIHTKVNNATAQCYVNGEAWGSTFTLSGGWWNNTSYRMMIGSQSISGGESGAVYAGYTYSQVYHVDGQAIGPEYFGHTDPLTGVWTPRKLTSVNDGSTWSDYTTGSHAFDSGRSPSDGMFAPGGASALISTAGSTITFAPPSLKYFDRVSVYVWSETNVSINGGPTQTVSATTLTDLTDSLGGGVINTITFSGTGSNTNVGEIHVDGMELYDDTTEVTWGTNGFYLPMNDDDYIGKDFSGNENHFRGDITTTASEAAGFVLPHTTLDKATGAIPILKTDPSGQIITGGPRTHKITYKVTVQNDGGNKYFLNGVRYSPGTIPMYRGGVYKFDQSDSTNATHPLRFATAADAAGSTEYTDGVTQSGTPGSAGAYTLIVVPHNAPDTLYYYCTNHGGMGGPTANTTDIHVADPYAWKLQLAVPFAGRYNTLATNVGNINYAQSSRGDSLNPLGADISLTNVGCQNAANEFVYYGGSKRYQGSTGHYQTLSNASTALAFGTEEFTVEFWAKFDTRGGSGYGAVLTTSTSSQNAGSWIIGFDNSDNFGWCWNVNTFSWGPAGKTQNTFREWHHYAFSRDSSNNVKMFIDGVQVAYGFLPVDYNYTGSTPKIGQRWTNSDNYSLQGELQDLRVYKGVSKYNTPNVNDGNIAFLCGSTRPSVLPEVPKGTPYPGFLKKTTSGSLHIYNDTTRLANRLTVPHHADLNMGNGDFTIEGFMYVDDISRSGGISALITKNGSSFGTSDTSWYIRSYNYEGMQFRWYDGSNWVGVNTLPAGDLTGWNHIACVKHGGKAYIFINGKKMAEEIVSAGPQDTTEDVTIGTAGTYGDATGQNATSGYISNVRIVKGTAVYTDDFEPPTENLENIPGTVLLCCQSSTNVTEAAVSPTTITANGRAGASNFSPFINNLAQLRGPENNYAVMEPTKINTHAVEVVDGGLSISGGTGAPWNTFPGTMGVSSGKWYWEVYPKSDNVTPIIGAAQDGSYYTWYTDVYPGQFGYGNSFGLQSNGTLHVNGTSTGGWHNSFGLNNNNNATISIALDMDAGKAYIAVNGFWGPLSAIGTNEMVSSGTATAAVTGLTGTYRPVYALNGGDSNDRVDVNFGQRPFRFTPPEGFKCLNRTNLPAPTKAAWNANKNFGTILWDGNGVDDRNITTTEGFAPDFVWIKRRTTDDGTGNHVLFDTVRGATKRIMSNFPNAEDTQANDLQAFNSDGFQIGTQTRVNATGETYVAWCWKAGGTAVSNTEGTITSSVSANTDAGFSIVSYTGNETAAATVGHGLTEPPECIFFKNRTSGSLNWLVYHKYNESSAGAGDGHQRSLILNTNAAGASESSMLNNTAPSNSVITLGTAGGSNGSTTMIAYCWHSVEGFSSVGKYIGNGDASGSGPVVYTEFKPAFVMIKRINSTGDWFIHDSARYPTNPSEKILRANTNAAESGTGNDIDLLSNGFKIRNSVADVNGSGWNYLYIAFAEAPTNAGFGAVVNAR